MAKRYDNIDPGPITNEDDRTVYIGSRDQVLDRSWVTLLWMEVIAKAKEDLALFLRMHEDGESLSEEDKFYADTAYSFLFVDGYTIALGNTEITIEDLLRNWREIKSIDKWRKQQWKDIRKKVRQKRSALKTRRERQRINHGNQRQ